MYPQAVLSFTLPNGEKRVVPLSAGEPILIGRNRSSTIKLNLPSVSRSHAKIYFERDAFWIEDLGSSNGTFVNQKQVQKARVSIGDVLKCGDFVIAVRNSSDRSSLPPIQGNKTDSASAVPASFDHTTNIGRRRESLPPPSSKPSAQPVQTNPWHSKAPTHGPEEPVGGALSPAPINDNMSIGRQVDEGLSTAYSNAKLRTMEHNDSSAERSAQVSQHSLQSQFSKTSEEENTELMRLRIVEKQLTDELTFQVSQIEQLQLQSQEYQERIANLESELDRGAQQFNELRQSALDAEREVEEELNNSHQELEELRASLNSLEEKLRVTEDRLKTQEHDFSRELELLENEKEQLLALSQDQKETQNLEQEIRALNQELLSLREENKRLSSEGGSTRDATAIHVFSLPRPNQEYTDPQWARHQAKFEQLIDELSYFQRRNIELEEKLSSFMKGAQSTEHNTALIQRQVSSMSAQHTSDELSASELSLDTGAGVPTDESGSDRAPNTSTNTRRAWRGML